MRCEHAGRLPEQPGPVRGHDGHLGTGDPGGRPTLVSQRGLIGLAAESKAGKDRMPPEEMAELHEISANLRAACTRMWRLSE